MLATLAEVTLPFSSIVRIGISEDDPYDDADTPEFARVVEIPALADPSKLAVPVTSPVSAIALAVVSFVDVPEFPVVSALIVAGRLIVIAPADEETSTSFAVPTKDVTPVLVTVIPAFSDPEPVTSIPVPAVAVAT